jgi:oligoribonuclease NrnB/cAMP/cGMP phosphodiesterase (DHH superfamily)
MKLICIYHSRDLDGFSSAAIVKKKYPDAQLIGFDYGQALPMEKIPAGVPIIMVDVSVPMQDLEMLSRHSEGQLTWVDHHATAIREWDAYMAGKEKFMETVLGNGYAACELIWGYLYPEVELPLPVLLLGEYDTWRKGDIDRWENKILPFQFGMRSVCNSPETFPERLLAVEYPNRMLDYVDETMLVGKAILQYQAQVSELLCRRSAFEFTFDGHRAICLNAGGINSDAFKSVYDEEKHDVIMPFFFAKDKWLFSLYTTKETVDCGALAKARGGGGHKGAAGFEVTDLNAVFVGQIPGLMP